MGRSELFKAAREAVEFIKPIGRRKGSSLLIHHDEADGICSAAIASKALESLGFTVKPICLEKLYREVLEEIYRSSIFDAIVFTDIGGAHAGYISRLNTDRIPTIILDHHKPEQPSNPSVFNLSPDLYGLNGDEISASTVAYIFAKVAYPEAENLAHLALIGSAEIPGPIRGLDMEATQDAIRRGLVEPAGREDYRVKAMGRPLSYKKISGILSILGSVGYYRGGPTLGLKACLEGLTGEIESFASKLEDERREANRKLLSRLYREGLTVDGYTQWFHVEDSFSGMGVKVIGSFCSYLRYQKRIVRPDLYIIGFMHMSREIPGFNPLKSDYSKVSGRLPEWLEGEVKKGLKPPLSIILPKACETYGGFGDGHTSAASGVVLRGEEEGFIEEFNRLVSEYTEVSSR
ncbi:MAG: hypothetical protein N3E44_03820 [Candidatus Bathyarchaeota archaeon]|nr:hypothetical protein [Candidatus Bathyarchaeota archaeon]